MITVNTASSEDSPSVALQRLVPVLTWPELNERLQLPKGTNLVKTAKWSVMMETKV